VAAAALALVAVLSQAPLGEGGGCARFDGAGADSIAAGPARARLTFLATALRREARKDLLWHSLWGAGYLGLAIGQAVISPFAKEDERVEWFVGLSASVVGMFFSGINPLEVVDRGEPFAAAAEHASDPEVCGLIVEGERLLVADAAKQKAQRSWVMHLLTAGFNAGVALVLGLGFGRWRAAVTDFFVGEAIGTATILTRPNALGDAERYRSTAAQVVEPRLTLAPVLSRDLFGLSVRVSF
jgi:hypothetical protein